MSLLSIFSRINRTAGKERLERAAAAHEDAVHDAKALAARKDTRGQHTAEQRARKALHDRMREELAVNHG